MVGLSALEDRALVGGAADFERLAVEVLSSEGKNLAERRRLASRSTPSP
jgi:hypothetical protein